MPMTTDRIEIKRMVVSIASINADGTFTHVEEVDLNDGDDY